MPDLQRLRGDHESAVLAFELANRNYFAAFVSDRGDNFFDHFTEQLGYRVAQDVTGRGVATATVREVCRLAVDRHGLRTLDAAATSENVASQKVLAKCGFVLVGPADPSELGGKPGFRYQLKL